MKNEKKVTAIILAAGNSVRYGQNRNKNFEEVSKEKTVLSYSLNIFDKNNYIDDIIIATKKEEIENVIKVTDSDIVIIHDGARPAVRQEYINKCIESMNEFKGVTIGVKAKDTIKIANDNNVVESTTNRANTWVIQTPQCFDRNVLLQMHEKYRDNEVTDDCMLLEKDNYKIKIIEGDYSNIKITTYGDLGIIKSIINNEKRK